jgi:hypothetical protein
MIPAPLRIRFRADMLEPVAHFLLKSDRAEPCHITFTVGSGAFSLASALREEQPDGALNRLTASSSNCYVSRDATLNFNRRVLSSISTALLTRPDHVEESDVLVEIDAVEGSPWLNTVRFTPSPDNPADAVIYHVAEVDPSLDD